MKFACEFFSMFFNIQEYDELLVHLAPTHDIDKIEDFFKQHPNQTIILWVEDMKHFNQQKWLGKLLKLIPIEKYQWKLKVRDPWLKDTQEVVEECRNTGVHFLYDILIDSWDVVQNLIQYQPSDMYITNSLGFDIVQVSKVLHDNNINVRVYPNISQSSVTQDNGITSFFIRPEDAQLYNQYIDVFEIFTPIDADNLKAFYYIMYANNLKWKGVLEEFIIGLNPEITNVQNVGLLNFFAPIRLSCKRECQRTKQCRMCNINLQMGQIMTNNNIGLQFTSEKPTKISNKNTSLPINLKEQIQEDVLNKIGFSDFSPELKEQILENLKKI